MNDSSSENLVEMRDVKLRFGEKVILDGVNLSIKPQEILVIMGMSGGGKSTLLSILLGTLPANEGFVRFKKSDMTKLPRPELNRVRMHIGMVYQNAALVSSMNVKDNVALPLEELSDKNAKEIAQIVDQKLELVGLKDAKGKLPGELSGGMQKRVGLARALVLEPELVLFDEPSAGLDPINTKHIDDLILDLRENHKTASIVVTHEMDSAFAVATRMAFLDKGKIILDGTPEDFRKSDNATVREFLAPITDQKKDSHANPQK